MPLVTGFHVELDPFMHICCRPTRSDKKAFIQLSVSVLIPIELSLLVFFFLVIKLALHGRSIISWRGGDSTIKSAIVGCRVVCDLCVH